jgi:hypothetical protein
MNNILVRFFVITFSPCSAEKCIVVVNKDEVPQSDVSLIFSSLIELNKDAVVPVTTFNPFYNKNLGMTDNNGRICFKQQAYKDTSYLYRKNRLWSFSKNGLKNTYYSFESIPDRLVLTKASETHINSELKDIIHSVGE